MHKQFYVYIHKKPDGTPFYVGKGTGNRAYQFSKRTQWHKNIVAKYRKENIIVQIINCISESQAFDLEKIYIKQFKIDGIRIVNLTNGGEGCSGIVRGKPTEEHKRKNGDARRGKKQSEETKKKRSEALKGQKRLITPEWRAKIALSMKGKPSPRLGAKLSDETKAKISESQKIRLTKKKNNAI